MHSLEGAGAEPLVLCVHGYCQSSAYWAPTLDRLARAAVRGLAPDLPGFGASARLPGPYTMEAYADGLAALLDARGLGAGGDTLKPARRRPASLWTWAGTEDAPSVASCPCYPDRALTREAPA
jgi:pimeloyl-ACP methyl ester carboxylesterase